MDVPERQAIQDFREIEERFGRRVHEIVRHCTKAEIDKTGSREAVNARRQTQAHDYVEHLRSASPSVKLVAAADKLHNARAIVSDCRTHGDKVWDRFNKTKDETLAYYAELAVALRGGDERSQRVVDELQRTVAVMHELARVPMR